MISQIDKDSIVFKGILFFVIFALWNRVFSFPSDSLKKIKIGILPSAFYSPETRLGFGGLFYSYFRISKKDSVTKKSNTQSYISYTLNKQFAFENDYQLWLRENKYYFTGTFDYSRFPQFFYGIGNSTRENDKMMISFDIIRFQTKALAKFNEHIYGGIFFQYHNVFNQDVTLLPNSTCMEIFGNMGFEAEGIGPVFMIDKRDNPLNPSKGGYLETSYLDYKNIINNQNMFTSLVIDARKYATFFKRLIWNGNLYVSHNKGKVPYKMLPEIGGARFLRGYYRGRFRDNNMAILQQEFRMPVYKMFGVALFGGIGSVAKSLYQFKTNEIHYDYGVGLRIRVNKKENTNVRIDYGVTKDSQGLYIVFAEAF